MHQPSPDKAPDLLGGIIAIRKMHIRVMEECGLTSADEMLYPENRSYLMTCCLMRRWAHAPWKTSSRLTASGMDIPVGMKNPHQRRPFRDAQLRPGGPGLPHFFSVPGLRCDHQRKPSGPYHSAGAVWINTASACPIIIMRISCAALGVIRSGVENPAAIALNHPIPTKVQ